MKRTLFLFSHQLHPRYLEHAQIQKGSDDIIFVDSDDQWTRYRFHQQRILLHLSAMQHAVNQLKKDGHRVELKRANTLVDALKPYPNLIAFQPTNHYEKTWLKALKIATLYDDPLFLIQEKEWPTLLPEKKSWKLDPLYRQFRQRFNILMADNQPLGGQYSFDQDNRQPPKKGLTFTPALWFSKDATTRTIENDIHSRFNDHPGETDSFAYPVTRHEALAALTHFLSHRLETFGTYQDAMLADQPWMSHSLISSSLNLGLLSPQEILDATMAEYHQGRVSLAATEGFVRQSLGWREYVRGIYLVLGANYLSVNAFAHDRPLPTFFYDGDTKMQCLQTTIKETIDHAYNHHIQRLMILSNYANLTEVKPQLVNAWFNEMYIDSSEWVVAANVLGMGLHADGGKMATKPYISSGAYIHKMSDYCDRCEYQVTLKTGEKACPFNSLYWHYLATHQAHFKTNPRMAMMFNVLAKMPVSEQQALIKQAKTYLT
jgi:deoxyribodipyrimidine photolyase-related protein